MNASMCMYVIVFVCLRFEMITRIFRTLSFIKVSRMVCCSNNKHIVVVVVIDHDDAANVADINDYTASSLLHLCCSMPLVVVVVISFHKDVM